MPVVKYTLSLYSLYRITYKFGRYNNCQYHMQRTMFLRGNLFAASYWKFPSTTRFLHASANCQQESKSPLTVFDRNSKLLQRERAALMSDHHLYDYLKDEIGYNLVDRIQDIKKDFKICLDLGCGKGNLSKYMSDCNLEHLHMAEFSPGFLKLADVPKGIKVTKKVVDEEKTLPYESKSMDIVVSNLSLHWVNNLPGCLKEIVRILKEDGVFLASMFSGDTLFQLRSSFILAELEREGGFAPHVSPFTENKDLGSLLNQAGFILLTIDTDELVVNYPSLFALMDDLKGMGENNASVNRKLHFHRDTLMAAAAIYQEMYGKEDGSIPATFQVTFMIGWKPDPSNIAKVAERGSGQISIKDLDKLNELIKERGMEGRVKFMEEMDLNNRDGNDDDTKA